MKRLPATRAPSGHVAPGVESCLTPAPGTRSEPPRTPAAWLEGLRRISELHANLAAEVRALVQNLEDELAVTVDQSVHAGVPELAPDPPKPTKNALLTRRELAAILGCHLRTLRRLELEGQVPASVRKGRLKRWRRSDIDRWLAEGGRRR